MNIRTAIAIFTILSSCGSCGTPISRNIYHFTACSSVSTAVVFQIPGHQSKNQRETGVTVRGELLNNSRLLVKKGEQNSLSLPLKKGNIDTTISVQNHGETLSFYVLTDSSQLSVAGTQVMADRASEGIAYLANTSSDGIGVFEIIVKR